MGAPTIASGEPRPQSPVLSTYAHMCKMCASVRRARVGFRQPPCLTSCPWPNGERIFKNQPSEGAYWLAESTSLIHTGRSSLLLMCSARSFHVSHAHKNGPCQERRAPSQAVMHFATCLTMHSQPFSPSCCTE